MILKFNNIRLEVVVEDAPRAVPMTDPQTGEVFFTRHTFILGEAVSGRGESFPDERLDGQDE